MNVGLIVLLYLIGLAVAIAFWGAVIWLAANIIKAVFGL